MRIEDLRATSEAYRNLATLLGTPPGEGLPDEVKAEYQRLFQGPGHLVAPPWESVYRTEDHTLCGPPTLAVAQAYRAAGLAVPNAEREPEDHIAIELSFMAALYDGAAEALVRGASPDPWLETADRFLQEHLLCWGGVFAQDMLTGAATPFYRSVAETLQGLLAAEAGALAQDH